MRQSTDFYPYAKQHSFIKKCEEQTELFKLLFPENLSIYLSIYLSIRLSVCLSTFI